MTSTLVCGWVSGSGSSSWSDEAEEELELDFAVLTEAD
jgi:hypothetical protein